MAQFNFYVNAHAEELRKHFVAHEGKKTLMIERHGTLHTVDFGCVAQEFIDYLHSNLVDKELHQWVLPEFTTTTANDKTVCAVIMMSTLKSYFGYTIESSCGIPSVALEGEKSDWETLLARVSKLEEFGSEPTAWANMLRSILRRFVSAFDGEPDVDFWSKVAHQTPNFSGPTYLSGWLTAFCVWTKDGKWQAPSLNQSPEPDFLTVQEVSTSSDRSKKRTSFSMRLITSAVGFFLGRGRNGNVYVPYEDSPRPLVLDGITYPVIRDIPNGFCEVDVTVRDNGEPLDCVMVAGHMAMHVVTGESGQRDTVRPSPHWFMYRKVDEPATRVASDQVWAGSASGVPRDCV